MTDGSTTPSSILLGGLIALLIIIVPISVIISTPLTNLEGIVKINKVD